MVLSKNSEYLKDKENAYLLDKAGVYLITNNKENDIMPNTKKYVSLSKLTKYDELLKTKMAADDAAILASANEFAESLASNYDAAGSAASAQSAAIAAAKTETTTQVNALANGAVKGNTDAISAIKDGVSIDSFADVEAALAGKQDTGDYATKTEAQGYANAKDGAIAEAKSAGEAAQATANANAQAIDAINHADTGILATAKSFATAEDAKVQGAVDALAGKVGEVPEGSTVMGIITNIQENAYDDTELVAKIDGVDSKVTTLVGEDADKSVRTIANEELTKQLVADGAKESLDTLTEIAAWIQSHPDDASAMNEAITALQNKVDTGDKTVSAYVTDAIAALSIGDYAKAADLTALAGRVSSLETASATHALKTEVKAVSDALTEYQNAHAGDYTNTQVDSAIEDAVDAEVERVDALLANKVDKVDGKGLSTNDLTDALKANYDAAYAHSQAAHAPVGAQANIIESVKVNGTALTVADKAVDITVPTKVSELTNDVPYLVAADIANKADKATTLAGYGITDAYTSAQTDAAIANAMALFVEVSESEINQLFGITG